MLALATVLVLVRRLIAWLSDEVLRFEVLFVGDRQAAALADERELLELALREQIANGTVQMTAVRPEEVARCWEESSRRSLAPLLTISFAPHAIETVLVPHLQLLLRSATPGLTIDEDSLPRGSDDLGGWRGIVEAVLAALR